MQEDSCRRHERTFEQHILAMCGGERLVRYGEAAL